MNKLIFFIGIIFSMLIQDVIAEQLVAFACDKKNNEIIIINSLNNETDSPGKYYHGNESLHEYNPWDLVTIDENSTRITDMTEIKEVCNLKYGDYTIYIRPEVFNRNVLGGCGAVISGNISIMSGNKVIIDKVALREDCHVKKYIRSIKVTEIRQYESAAIVYDLDITTTEQASHFENAEGMQLLRSLGDKLRELRALPMSASTNSKCPNEVSRLNEYRQAELLTALEGLGRVQLLFTLGEPDFIDKTDDSWSYFFTNPTEPDQRGGGFPELSFSFGLTDEITNVTCSYSR